MTRTVLGCVALASFLRMAARPVSAQTTTAAGELSAEPPTLVSLGFDWKIAGDDNRNAQVEVSFRKKGDAPWRKGLPLLRLHGEEINGGIRPPNAAPDSPFFTSPFNYT